MARAGSSASVPAPELARAVEPPAQAGMTSPGRPKHNITSGSAIRNLYTEIIQIASYCAVCNSRIDCLVTSTSSR